MSREFNSAGQVVEQTFDWTSTPPSTAIAETVASAVDRGPTDIPPLYETIDPDALDTIIRSQTTPQNGITRTISFSFCEFWVTVDASGMVSLSTAE